MRNFKIVSELEVLAKYYLKYFIHISITLNIYIYTQIFMLNLWCKPQNFTHD